MLVIVASEWDEVALTLARRWSDKGAALLTPFDLSRSGWCWWPGSRSSNAAVIQGTVVDPATITGVLTRLPCVSVTELPHIIAHDREYVAAEMHAFLFAWLAELHCPVVNRPSAYCLAGTSWRHEQWLHLAAQIGIDVEPAYRRIAMGTPPQDTNAGQGAVTAITIAGNRHIGSSDPILVGQARQLAAAAGLVFVTVVFSDPAEGGKFLGVSLWPDVADPAIADLLMDVLAEKDPDSYGRLSAR